MGRGFLGLPVLNSNRAGRGRGSLFLTGRCCEGCPYSVINRQVSAAEQTTLGQDTEGVAFCQLGAGNLE